MNPRWPTFGVALGHQLRRVREEAGVTAEFAASTARLFGARWDRPTVGRMELGQRPVSVVELFLLARIYERPVLDLLPQEACRLTDDLEVEDGEVRRDLVESPRFRPGPTVVAAVLEGARRALSGADALAARFPENVDVLDVSEAARHVRDQAVTKAAVKLGVEPLDVAVLAEQRWERDLTGERDERVGVVEGESMRARQARRGHVTRTLLAELAPDVEALLAFRVTQGGDLEGESEQDGQAR